MPRLIEGAGGLGGGGSKKPRTPVVSPDSAFLRSVSFAQMQFLLCEGPIWGPVEGNTWGGLLASTYLDDTSLWARGLGTTVPVEDLVLSYGTYDQTAVPGYGVQWNTVGVGQAVKSGFPVFATAMPSDPSTPHRAKVVLTWEALLLSIKTTGDVLEAILPYYIDYVDAVGTYRLVYSGFVYGKFSGPFQREHEWDLAGPGPWTVRVVRAAVDDEQLENAVGSWRSAFSLTNLSYGPVVALGRRYSATLTLAARADRYSNLPAVAIDIRGKICKIPNTYNPWTAEYYGDWGGVFQESWTDNPAWCFYDMVTNPRYGLGESVEAALIDKWSLYSIGRYCDEWVPAAGGGYERRFRCNLILTTQDDAWVVLQQLASIFRGMVYWSAGLSVAIQDAPGVFLYTFNPSNVAQEVDEQGNVTQPCFEYQGTAKRARHTVCLASWDDPSNAYQPRVEYVADQEALSRLGYRPLELRLNGLTSRGQALRAARWALLSEALLDDTVTFKVGAVGMALRPGDLIKVMDPDKGGARFGGRVTNAVYSGTPGYWYIYLDAEPPTPTTGWGGGTFTWQGADGLVTGTLAGVFDNLAVVANAPGYPMVGAPWLIEIPSLDAQPFRIVGIAEPSRGQYTVTALRYRLDIYYAVDWETPLWEDESYLFKLLDPLPPTVQAARIIWDNNQAALEILWRPQDRTFVEGGFDLSTAYHRLQFQRGEVQTDGTISWTNQWEETTRQTDTSEVIPLSGYQVQTRYKVRMASVGKTGAESLWSGELVATPIEQWLRMPDFEALVPGPDGDPVPCGQLEHFNLPTGGHRWVWRILTQIPPYARNIEVWGRPAATPGGVYSTPEADGFVLLGAAPVSGVLDALLPTVSDWEIRARLTTFVPGLTGTSYMFDTVDRLEIVPPTPANFRVVVEQDGQSRMGARRFSWSMPDPPPFADRWPQGEVDDIAFFEVRYRNGIDTGWDGAFQLLSDGIPGDTFWFETRLMDYGTFTVMLRTLDRTGRYSEDSAVVTVGIGQPLPTNVLDLIDLSVEGWPGVLTNGTVSGALSPLFYEPPLGDVLYVEPLDERIYTGRSGGVLVQDDPTRRMLYQTIFEVPTDGSGLLIYTENSLGSTRWWVEDVSNVGDALRYVEPLVLPMYEEPLDLEFHLGGYVEGGRGEHPYAPHEKLTAGLWRITLEAIATASGVPAVVEDVDVVLDVPDVLWTVEDHPTVAGSTTIPLPPGLFRRVKAVSLSVQENAAEPGVAVGGQVLFKDASQVRVRTVDAAGTPTAALADLIVVGY